jgi:hypothetical protein
MKASLSKMNLIHSRASQIIVALVSLLFVFVLGSIWVLNPPKSVSSWGRANQIAPVSLVRMAVQQNYLILKTQKPLDENQIKALKVPDKGAGNFYLIDFNSQHLCGTGGCLYAIYTQKGQLVLRLLLNPHFPKRTPLFSISEQTRNGVPCLSVAQATGEENIVSRRRYCYEGSGFTLVNSSMTKGGV